MKLSEAELISFAQSIPVRCKEKRKCLVEEGQGSWDARVRKAFAKALDCWFLEYFPNVNPRDYVYIEGSYCIPYKKRGNAFFGTTMHPDAAIIMESQPLIAIELDHGNHGSQIRNALAKAGFSYLLGKYKQAMVLFFAETEKVVPEENEVLIFYKKRFNTTLYIL
jgi:hypothetical protein